MISKKEEDFFYSKLGSLLKIAREKANKSQEALADYLGLSRVTVVNIEKGRQKILIHDLLLASKFLNIDLLDLIPTNFEYSDQQLDLNLKDKISRKFHYNDVQASKIENFVKITLSNLSDKKDE